LKEEKERLETQLASEKEAAIVREQEEQDLLKAQVVQASSYIQAFCANGRYTSQTRGRQPTNFNQSCERRWR